MESYDDYVNRRLRDNCRPVDYITWRYGNIGEQ